MLYAVIISLLIIGIPLQVFPYFWMVTNAFKSNLEIMKLPPTVLPEHVFLQGVADTFRKYSLWNNILNTMILCGGIIASQVTISALAAYSLSKLKPKYSRTILLFFVGSMMISAQALMFPLYIMMVDFPLIHVSLINNFLAYILPGTSWGYTLFLFKGFFDGLPNELLESARIDGAGPLYIFTRIVLPLSLPVIAVNVLTTFVAVYNDYLFPLLVLPSEKRWTIMMRIFTAQNGSNATWNNIMVMLAVSTLPVIIMYLFAQKRLVQGIAMTGLKG